MIYQSLGFIKTLANSDVISASFDSIGGRTAGSNEIEIEKHSEAETPDVWFYSVKPRPEYTFVRIPVISSGIQELIGSVVGENNADARFWRWVDLPAPNTIVGGNRMPPNVKVDFIVVGYKANALIKHFSPGSVKRRHNRLKPWRRAGK